ncbi:MAG: sulfotransferase [Bacteroidetes bacterium]|nr:MAG: sulfotransferase [Bacteroidota bacterium]
MKMSFLFGANLPTLWRLLAAQQFRVRPGALPALGMHAFMASLNSLLALAEPKVPPAGRPKRPVFILGHWRSGTTHLLNLMDVGGAYLAPTTFEVAFPHIFLRWQKPLAPLLDRIGPGVRPMDGMALHMDSPQEEEIGLAALGAPSAYLAIHFSRDHEAFQKYVSFRDASPQERAQWEAAHRGFLDKLQAKVGPPRPLLLKSPTHTARVRWLLSLYPDARFVHIHRDPYDCIRSTLHLYDVWFQMHHFQDLRPMRAGRDAYVLDTYESLHRCWFEEADLIPPGQLHMLSFASLKTDPMAEMEKIYRFLGDAPFPGEALQTYLAGIRSYRQNRYDPLPPAMIEAINARMGFVFDGFGYDRRSPGATT